MSRYQTTKEERDILKVLKNEINCVKSMPSLKHVWEEIEANIATSEALLRSLGHEKHLENMVVERQPMVKKKIIVRSWDDLVKDANEQIPGDVTFEDLFSPEELDANRAFIQKLHDEFNIIHAFDTIDISIPFIAGVIGGIVDLCFGGFVKTTSGKNVPGLLSAYFRDRFNTVLPPDKIVELEKLAKVTFDAQDNRHTTIDVDGLSTRYHRLHQVGHDPFFGFIFGVSDMLRMTMTTIDNNGKRVVQPMAVYNDRQATNLFEAIAKVFLHMLSDVNTPMGLPVPAMTLLNTLQIGSIGEENFNVAELVKSMYGRGYDFRHFCSMSVSTMIVEIIVRVLYFVKRLSEGRTFDEAIPFGTRSEKPKLDTMLFIAHSASTAINLGKVALTRNPLNINYVQWLAFAKYSIGQLIWVCREKPKLREQYISGVLDNEWSALSESIDELWQQMPEDTVIVFE